MKVICTAQKCDKFLNNTFGHVLSGLFEIYQVEKGESHVAKVRCFECQLDLSIMIMLVIKPRNFFFSKTGKLNFRTIFSGFFKNLWLSLHNDVYTYFGWNLVMIWDLVPLDHAMFPENKLDNSKQFTKIFSTSISNPEELYNFLQYLDIIIPFSNEDNPSW